MFVMSVMEFKTKILAAFVPEIRVFFSFLLIVQCQLS